MWINTLMGDLESPAAVTGIGMNLTEVIDDLVRDGKSKVRNDIWLVDGNGVIYLSKNPAFMEKNIKDHLPSSLIDTMGSEITGRQFAIAEYADSEGKLHDIAYKRIKDTAWRLVVQIPRSESVGFLKTVTLNTVISCIIIILIMVATFFLLSNRIANPYKRALQLNLELEKLVGERTRELRETNAKILDSIEYARIIQQTILPSEAELKKNLKDYFIVYEPRDTVGGDFYWMKSHNGGLLLVVGDCTGHGVPGALMTTAVNAMLNHIVDGLCRDNPAVILNELDRLIKESFRKEGSLQAIPDGLDAAVLYVSNSGRALFAGANMSLFIADRHSVREIKGSTTTIDCIDRRKEKGFVNHAVEYDAGNAFYITTDGFRDQPGGEKLLSFGKRRLSALLGDITHLDMEEQKAQILSVLQEYEGNEMRRDDITFIGFRL